MNDGLEILEGLGASDLQSMLSQLLEILWDPTTNINAALLLYGIIALVILVVIVIVAMIVISAPEEGDTPRRDTPAHREREPVHDTKPLGEVPASGADSRLVTATVVVVVLAVIWIATGFSTSQSVVCTGCHVGSPHFAEEGSSDPHASTECVACHEPGGAFGHYVANVPFRMVHFVDGLVAPALQVGYGRSTQSACLSCHERGIREVVVDQERGLRMSHAEPLAASAACLDCHTMSDGIVAAHNVGMNPCLQCHDSQTASSECSTCHDRQAAAAARARTTSFASVQVEEVKCGACHDEKRQCDPCHGVRLPHEKEFMAYAHARAAAVDFWFGSGTTCQGSECHNPTRRPCQRCHGPMLGNGHGQQLALSHQRASSFSCDRCHQVWAISPQRDFCRDVCHSEAAIRYSPR